MTVEKSVIVQGKNVEEALQRAALLLHSSTVDLAYEVLQPGLVDQKGVVRIPYKLRVLPIVSAPAPRDEIDVVDDLTAVPFSRQQLEIWSNSEFIAALQAAIAAQPSALLETYRRRKHLSVDTLEVKGGLTPFHGSLLHDGDIIIHGNISRGVTVNAAGSIRVYGDVEVSQLDAGDDITISGGLLGIARSAHGSVVCHFAQGAYIESAKKITVLESSLHCNLQAGTIVDVGNTIIGGHSSAPQAIFARITGSETGVVTKLSAGTNNKIREEAESIRRQASRLIVKLGEATNRIKGLEPSDAAEHPTTVDDRLKLWNAMSEKARLNDRLVALSRRKNALIASIDQDRTARIKVSDKVHPQTQIEIDDVGLTVKKLTQFVTFSKDYEAGALRVTSFR